MVLAGAVSDPLLLLGVSRAEAAERSAVHLGHHLASVEKQHGKVRWAVGRARVSRRPVSAVHLGHHLA